MNVVSERDIELLEEYLDAALAPDEAECLRERLAEDSDLAAALEELASQGAVRTAVWSSLEPTDRQARQFASRVITAARQQALWSRVGRYSRFASAAAACLLIGFFAGWLGQRGPADARVGVGPGPVADVSDGLLVSRPHRAELGVIISEIRYEDPLNRSMPMLLVRDVLPGTPAQGAGLRKGDLLLAVDGEPVRDVASLVAALSSRPGTRVLRVLRDRQIGEIAVQVTRR